MIYRQDEHGRIVPVQGQRRSMQGMPLRGAGDLVARVAKPVARALGIQDCDACDQRQSLLNSMFPFRGRKQ